MSGSEGPAAETFLKVFFPSQALAPQRALMTEERNEMNIQSRIPPPHNSYIGTAQMTFASYSLSASSKV